MATIIKPATTGIMSTFGKFTKIIPPGLKLYAPWVHKIDLISNKTQNMNVRCEILTKDGIYAKMCVNLCYKIKHEDVIKSIQLEDPTTYIRSCVENQIRSNVPELHIIDINNSLVKITNNVESCIRDKMYNYGYTLEELHTIYIEPCQEVATVINHARTEINEIWNIDKDFDIPNYLNSERRTADTTTNLKKYASVGNKTKKSQSDDDDINYCFTL